MPRCQALDTYGLQCPSRQAKPYFYHGDGELYDRGSLYLPKNPLRYPGASMEGEPGWVVSYFCSIHSDNNKSSLRSIKTKAGTLWTNDPTDDKSLNSTVLMMNGLKDPTDIETDGRTA